MNKQHGITLLEVLIVTGILGILTAVTIPNVSRIVREHHIAKTSDYASIDRTIEGTIIAIDRGDSDSMLHFSGGIDIQVTNKSLDYFSGIPLNVPRTFGFHHNLVDFDLIHISFLGE